MANEAAGRLSSHLGPAERECGTLRRLHRNGLQNARQISKMPITPHSRLSLMRIRWRTHRKRTHTHTQSAKLGQCLRLAWPASSATPSPLTTPCRPHCISHIKNCLTWAWAKKGLALLQLALATCKWSCQKKLRFSLPRHALKQKLAFLVTLECRRRSSSSSRWRWRRRKSTKLEGATNYWQQEAAALRAACRRPISISNRKTLLNQSWRLALSMRIRACHVAGACPRKSLQKISWCCCCFAAAFRHLARNGHIEAVCQ